jgi:hypothetical protein
MNVPDGELVQLLANRDGPLAEVSPAHASGSACRYRSLYEDGQCPWCEAAERRNQREAVALNAALETSAKD